MLPPEAKVFADDVSLNYSSSLPYIAFDGINIDDSGGNNNHHLDSGENVNLITRLKNWGISATNVKADLFATDTFITIHSSHSDFGNIASGDTANNSSNPFIVESSSNTPLGHTANFTLVITTNEGSVDTSHFHIVVGKYHYLVWDPSPDQSSGPVIDATLQSLGYSGIFTQILPFDKLDNYIAVFVSCGIYSNNYVILDGSQEANALINYLNNNGRMYLEGGDVWYYDPLYMNGYDFGLIFGINATEDGSSDLTSVLGQHGTFTDAMSFTYSGENYWIDHISPTGTGFLIFQNSSPVYDCGVANDAGTYRTVGVSWEFSGLTNGSPPSTKMALADSIMHFFMRSGIQEKPKSDISYPRTFGLSQNYPNPFHKLTNIKYSLPGAQQVSISVFDVSGRHIRTLVNQKQKAGNHSITFDGSKLSEGIYFIKLKTDNNTASRKCIILR